MAHKKFVGKPGVFWLWMILFFPVAIVYYFANYEEAGSEPGWKEV